MSSDDEVREEKELDLSSNDVVTKYKAAAEILNSKFYLAFSLTLSFVRLTCCLLLPRAWGLYGILR